MDFFHKARQKQEQSADIFYVIIYSLENITKLKRNNMYFSFIILLDKRHIVQVDEKRRPLSNFPHFRFLTLTFGSLQITH